MRVLEPVEWEEVPQYVYIRVVGYVSAGFPAPGQDELWERISLDKECIRDRFTTFFWRVKGNSMENAFIPDGALLVVDRSLTAKDNCIVVAVVDNEIVVKRLVLRSGKALLQAESNDPLHTPLEITEYMKFEVWGVVTHIITNAKTI